MTEELSLTINGREVTSAPGRMLIDVAEEHDIFVPRFCYHPGLEPVAACRMCLVEIEGSRRPLEPACATPVADGMVVSTDAHEAVKAQKSVLELLLINHPLDCPICDRGGECPLQDQALRFGPGVTRYEDAKRNFPKALPISDLVMLDRERCVLCWRCVRFCDEVSGDSFIDLMDRGALTQINTADDVPFDSYFSGNTIQICPVGALTSRSYRFQSRPWDLAPTESTCSFCAVGCPVSLEQRGGELMRTQALPNENVNSFWICDKGRFGHRYPSHPDRLRSPLVRRASSSGDASQEFVAVSWDVALEEVWDRMASALASNGPSSIGFIGGSHLTNEDLYAASRFFREVIGTPHLDFRTFDAGFPYDAFGGRQAGSTAKLDDLDKAKTIIWVGPDPKEELPVLYLRLRKAVEGGAELIEIGPKKTSLASLGRQLSVEPGHEAPALNEMAAGGLEGPVVVCAGQPFVGYGFEETAAAVRNLLASVTDSKLLLCPPNANSQGALDFGVFPGIGPGHTGAPTGLDTGGMLRAAAGGELSVLWIAGADLTQDFPDGQLVEEALSSAAYVVVSELFPTETARAADVLLPAASFAEKEGSFTNLERRIQKVNPSVPPLGSVRAEWHIFDSVADRAGRPFGWSGAADVAAEIAQMVPTHGGFSWEKLEGPRSASKEAVSVPPEGGHAAGESGRGAAEPRTVVASELAGFLPTESDGAWPLRWELRAVDAERRSGWIWEGEGTLDSASSPGPERVTASAAFPLMILVGRALYDNGQMVRRSPELRNLTTPAFIELNPGEAGARGLEAGQEVVVNSSRGSLRGHLRISEGTPMGAVFMLLDQPGLRANALLDASTNATYAEVSG